MKNAPNPNMTQNQTISNDECLKAVLSSASMPPDDLSLEAIAFRANYVGPVLEEILHELETHWEENHDIETWQDCDDSVP